MPGAAPVDSGGLLPWVYIALGQHDDAKAVLSRTAAIPDLARWHPRPVVVKAGRALLEGDAAGLDAAIAAARGPTPFSIAMMWVIGAMVFDGATRIRWCVKRSRFTKQRARRRTSVVRASCCVKRADRCPAAASPRCDSGSTGSARRHRARSGRPPLARGWPFKPGHRCAASASIRRASASPNTVPMPAPLCARDTVRQCSVLTE